MSLADLVAINEHNLEPRQALLLLLDTSGSMAGESVDALNAGLLALQRDLSDPPQSKRVEVAIVTFGPSVQVQTSFTEVARFEPPTLTADGQTPMGEAILLALRMSDERKALYKSKKLDYYRPWIFMITDGGPSFPDWETAATAVRAAEASKTVAFYAVGTDSADFDTLARISVRPPLKLKTGHWKELFHWMSVSMARVSQNEPGKQVPMETPGWGETPG